MPTHTQPQRNRWLPAWLTSYRKQHLLQDILAGIIVAVLVTPQSLGYALLAGLPPVYGLYAAIVPVLVYAWVGASPTQAVGPVAITAIMTAQALTSLGVTPDTPLPEYISLVTLLTLLVGLLLWLASLLRLGLLMQFISRGVVAGFVSGAAVIIFFSQIKYLSAIPVTGNSLVSNLYSIATNISALHLPTLWVGLVAFTLLLANRYFLAGALARFIPKLNQHHAAFVVRIVPLVVVVCSVLLSSSFDWQSTGMKTIGKLPQGLPSFAAPALNDIHRLLELLPFAALIALIGFISSAAIAQQFGRKQKASFEPNDELKGLGLANIAGAFFQSFPVASGFSRTAVNVDAGARSPLAGVISALSILAILLIFGYLLAPLPYAILGAGIMAAVVSLLDVQTFTTARQSDQTDATCFAVTFIAVLLFGLNVGLVIGLLFSFAALIWRTSQPHTAIIGQVGDTGHFRNIYRHDVRTFNELVIFRIDESLYFGNVLSIQNQIDQALMQFPKATNLVLVLSAVNHIDLSAQDMLNKLDDRLISEGKRLHFAEVKGPVMDKIKHTKLISDLSGEVFLSTLKAVKALTRTQSDAT